MLGDVYVTVVLMESDGSIDPTTEDWTPTQISRVKAEVEEGLRWWEDTFALQSASGHLSFYPDFTYTDAPVPTGYEPITRSSTAQSLWMDDFLAARGYSRGDFMVNLAEFNNAQRIAHQTQWACTVFVVNSEADSDGKFSDNDFAYAFLGGPVAVMTYDNDGWGINSMAQVLAHEMGHIFYALDEYSGAGSYSEHSGYYNTQNLNAVDGNPAPGSRVPSVMADPDSQDQAYAAHTSSPSSLEMIGWRDSDADGIFDVLDVPFSLSGSGHYNAATGTFDFAGTSSVATLANQNPIGNGNDITINTVDHLQYRLDGGAWTEFAEYGGYSATISVSIPVPATGAHQIELRTIDDDTLATSAVWSASFSGMLGMHVVSLGIGQVKSGLDFGDRQTPGSSVQGTAGDEDYYVALNEGGTAVLVYPASTPTVFPIHSFPLSSGPTLTIDLGDGNDTVTLGGGLGGLRGIHHMRWLERIFALAGQRLEVFNAEERVELEEAHDFLLRTRTALHLAAGRHADTLIFEHQPQVAEALGFSGPRPGLAVEAFLSALHRAMTRVKSMRRAMGRACCPERPEPCRNVAPGLHTGPAGLEFQDPSALARNPALALDLFLAAARSGRDVSWQALRAVRAALPGLGRAAGVDVAGPRIGRVGHDGERLFLYAGHPPLRPGFPHPQHALAGPIGHVFQPPELFHCGGPGPLSQRCRAGCPVAGIIGHGGAGAGPGDPRRDRAQRAQHRRQGPSGELSCAAGRLGTARTRRARSAAVECLRQPRGAPALP
jgi:hypothetical protein